MLGAAAAQQSQTRVVWAFTVGALIGILLLIQAASSSWRRSAVLLVLLPLSVVGGVLVAPLAGGVQSAGAMAGLFAALTLTARGGIALLRRITALEGENGWAHDPAVVLEATRDQAAQIVQTALCVALVALPAVVLGSRAGLELLHPMAVVLLGALVSVVLVLMAVLPAVLILVSPRGGGGHFDHPVGVEPVPVSA